MKNFMQLFSKSIFIISFFCIIKIDGQTKIKINGLFSVVGIINIAAEKALNNKFSIQSEIFISPWKSFHGKNMQIYMGTLEGRYYFDETINRWYVGSYLSFGAFNMQKWNYLKSTIIYNEDGSPQVLPDGNLRVTERYQKGFAFVIGISGGYHFRVTDTIGLDIYAGIGAVQSLYKGYFKDNEQRYDEIENWNKSGEIIPTRGGIMATYKL